MMKFISDITEGMIETMFELIWWTIVVGLGWVGFIGIGYLIILLIT